MSNFSLNFIDSTGTQAPKVFEFEPQIFCPDRCILNDKFRLKIKLLIPLSRANQAMEPITSNFENSIKLEVVLRTYGFEIEGSNVKVLQVNPNYEPEVDFTLTPLRLGKQEIKIDFYQYNRHIYTLNQYLMIVGS